MARSSKLYSDGWPHPRFNSGINMQHSSIVSNHHSSPHSSFELTVYIMKTTTITLLLTFFIFQASALDTFSQSTNKKAATSSKHAATIPVDSKSTRYSGCNEGQVKQIILAARASNNMINEVNNFIEGFGSKEKKEKEEKEEKLLYKKYFGIYAEDYFNHIKLRFGNMVNQAPLFAYDCQPCFKPRVNSGAFKKLLAGREKKRLSMYIEVSRTIRLCPGFWEASVRGINSQGGAIIRELSRARDIGGTNDYGLTQTRARELAKKDFANAVMSADNHMY
ncbi:peptidyl-lys metalloendopeptidase, partial [Rhizoctonia solani 123E]